MKKDNYIIEGVVGKLVASEKLRFGDYAVYTFIGDRVGVKQHAHTAIDSSQVIIDSHEYAGRVISDLVEEGDAVEILFSGHIIPKERETEYREQLRRGLMLSIFSCIGDMFGYNVTAEKILVEANR